MWTKHRNIFKHTTYHSFVKLGWFHVLQNIYCPVWFTAVSLFLLRLWWSISKTWKFKKQESKAKSVNIFSLWANVLFLVKEQSHKRTHEGKLFLFFSCPFLCHSSMTSHNFPRCRACLQALTSWALILTGLYFSCYFIWNPLHHVSYFLN